MILISPNVTDLAAGCALLKEFIDTLESTWLPGFERSYERRINEYQAALEKYMNRGLFLRTLLRKPKRPNRMPPGFKEELAERLFAAWFESFTVAPPAARDEMLSLLQETLDDRFLAILDLQLQADLAAPIVVIGPPGIILAAGENALLSSPPPPEQRLQQSAITLRKQLQQTAFAETAVHAGRLQYWQQHLAEFAAGEALDQQQVCALADELLARQQELGKARTFSALSSAEKLTAREKENLLRMAATL